MIQATLHPYSTSLYSDHTIKDIRKITRLAIFPNFLHHTMKTSFTIRVLYKE